MDIHYNAFISYRHHPDDIKVAKQIHQQLERFQVPPALKKQGKRIDRLFRDKEELPITSCLSEDIDRALENSDYLIVICSPHTKESVWVQREIETFLKTHDRNRVLTVLAAGEPYEVIPEILLYEEQTDPETGTTRRVEFEPLSCDWRLKRKQAVREELPRLAAALLGCAYDELRQRQRQYRMRRTMAVFSVALVAALCLLAYFITTSIRIQRANEQLSQANVEIRNNLDQALRNQSKYLAATSGELLREGDRLTALALALAALPDEDNPRPYVSAAEYALNNALSAYNSAERISARAIFNADAMVETFLLTQDEQTLYILDARDMITVWDAQNFKKRASIDMAQYGVDQLRTTPSGNLIVMTGYSDYKARCFDSSGQPLWEVEDCLDVAFSDDGSMLMLQYKYGSTGKLLFTDPQTGLEKRPAIELPVIEGDATPKSFFQEQYYENAPITVKYYTYFNYYLCLVDQQTAELTTFLHVDSSSSAQQIQYLDAVHIDQNGNLLVMLGDETGSLNGQVLDAQITGLDRATVQCYDSATGKLCWQTQMESFVYGDQVISSIMSGQQVLIQNGNLFQIHDMKTGELLRQHQTPTMPLTVSVRETDVFGVLDNGMYFGFKYDGETCTAITFTDKTLDCAAVGENYYVHTELTSHVTVFGTVKGEEGIAIDAGTAIYGGSHIVRGNTMLVWYLRTLYMVDVTQQTLLWKQEFDYNHELLHFSEDGSKVWMWNKTESMLVCLDGQSGEQTQIPVDTKLENVVTYLESNMFAVGDMLYYLLEFDGGLQLHGVDMSTGARQLQLDIPALAPEKGDYQTNSVILAVTQEHVWLWSGKERLCTVHLADAAVQEVAVTTALPVCTQQDGQMLITAENKVLLMQPDGTVITQLDLEDRQGVSSYMHGDQLLVLCNDGAVYRYDSTGSFQSKIALELYNTFYNNAESDSRDQTTIFWRMTPDGDLILNAFGAGNIIDCESWELKTFVENMFAYLPQLDQIVCRGDNLMVYKRYTLAQQMEKAREELENYPLTQTQKDSYGL